MKTAKPPARKASDNYVEIPPNAARTLAALRELGYDSLSAISDLIDNSIDAGAKTVSVTVRQVGTAFVIEILDDGSGMSRERLQEAVRLGSDTDKNVTEDLGKYGMGLTTAGLSIAKTIFIVTREKAQQGFEATFDVTTVERENNWVLDLRPAQTKQVLEEVGDHGTLVRLSNVDRLDDTNPARFVTRLKEHIGRVFRYFLADGIIINVNRRHVLAIDPLMRDHGMTEQRLDADIDLGQGHKAHMTIVELPDIPGEEDSGVIPRKSGFYIVRNKREIAEAQTFGFPGLSGHHHSYSHFRAELRFTGDLDTLFHVDVKKTTIHPNDKVLEKIQHAARRFIEQSGREGRDRALAKHEGRSLQIGALRVVSQPAAADDGLRLTLTDHGNAEEMFTTSRDNGALHISVNARHPLSQVVNDIKSRKAQQLFHTMCLSLAAVSDTKEGREFSDRVIRVMTNVALHGTPGDTWSRRDSQSGK